MEYLKDIPPRWSSIPKHFQAWIAFFKYAGVAVSDEGIIIFAETWERFRENHLRILLKQEYAKAREVGFVETEFRTKQLEREIDKFLKYFRGACKGIIHSDQHIEDMIEKDTHNLSFIK